jgi:hypothetical protein
MATLYEGLKEFHDRYITALSAGDRREANEKRSVLSELYGYMDLYYIALYNGDDTSAQEQIDAIEEVLADEDIVLTPGTPFPQGAPGLITNRSNILIPTDIDGSNPVYTNANFTVIVILSGGDDTSNWSLSKVDVSLTSNLVDDTITITDLSADYGYVDVTASRSGYESQTIRVFVYKAAFKTTNVDNVTIEYDDSQLQVKNGGITPQKLSFTINNEMYVSYTFTSGSNYTTPIELVAGKAGYIYTLKHVVFYNPGDWDANFTGNLLTNDTSGATWNSESIPAAIGQSGTSLLYQESLQALSDSNYLRIGDSIYVDLQNTGSTVGTPARITLYYSEFSPYEQGFYSYDGNSLSSGSSIPIQDYQMIYIRFKYTSAGLLFSSVTTQTTLTDTQIEIEEVINTFEETLNLPSTLVSGNTYDMVILYDNTSGTARIHLNQQVGVNQNTIVWYLYYTGLDTSDIGKSSSGGIVADIYDWRVFSSSSTIVSDWTDSGLTDDIKNGVYDSSLAAWYLFDSDPTTENLIDISGNGLDKTNTGF